MKFKAIVKVKVDGAIRELKTTERATYEEARTDGETSKAIWGDEFIEYNIVEV